ncbi:hypothetical protein [Pseudomonas sp. Fl4BN1]|uniref:hypothetical protein n=1 Tax=Pseudomonas sp. Fl4BN1 TaxID=2697651 RepID=UPI001376510F|nr:hypothetical protein [Pseudomonas sp. Fl4BN1]NBF09202.1 hypothetical protein [Pseudomonas sp. Fl4BN1]
MKDISYYESLPDLLSEEKLHSEFMGVLDSCGHEGYENGAIVKIIVELSDRQWNSYSYMNDFLKARVEDVLLSLWDGTDLEYVEDVIAISARLGLVRLFEFLSSRQDSELSGEVAAEIKSAVVELREHISDPYSGMR